MEKGTEAPVGTCCCLRVLSGQALSHGSSRISLQDGLGDEAGRRAKEIVSRPHLQSTCSVFPQTGCLFGVPLGRVIDGDYEAKAPTHTHTHSTSLFLAALLVL